MENCSNQCPIILVCGFMGPANAHFSEMYWGSALEHHDDQHRPVFVAALSCVGSAYDRACELYAQIKGLRVDFGEEHSKTFGHARYGKDFTGKGLHPEWSADSPVHLVGHSFGGNTVRTLFYLLATNHFEDAETSSRFVTSLTTLTSPLKGSLLTYTLGANEDALDTSPVKQFSPGYLLGMTAHFYELFCRKLSFDRLFDFGLEHWNLDRGGLSSFWHSFWHGGENGGGTPCVCRKDNAAHDMTIPACMEMSEKIAKILEQDEYHFQFNLVAKKRDITSFSFFENLKRRIYGDGNAQERNGSQGRSGFLSTLLNVGLHMRDFWVSHAATTVQNTEFKVLSTVYDDIHMHQNHESDGLCSAFSQFESDQWLNLHDVGNSESLKPGQYSILLEDHHDHFSIVPFPDCRKQQHQFFHQLFTMLHSVPLPPTNQSNPNSG